MALGSPNVPSRAGDGQPGAARTPPADSDPRSGGRLLEIVAAVPVEGESAVHSGRKADNAVEVRETVLLVPAVPFGKLWSWGLPLGLLIPSFPAQPFCTLTRLASVCLHVKTEQQDPAISVAFSTKRSKDPDDLSVLST